MKNSWALVGICYRKSVTILFSATTILSAYCLFHGMVFFKGNYKQKEGMSVLTHPLPASVYFIRFVTFREYT